VNARASTINECTYPDATTERNISNLSSATAARLNMSLVSLSPYKQCRFPCSDTEPLRVRADGNGQTRQESDGGDSRKEFRPAAARSREF